MAAGRPPRITEEHFKTVDTIMNAFSKTMTRETPDAVERFTRNLGFFEKAQIVSAKLSYEFAKNAEPKVRATKLAAYCESALPGLLRTFGEATVLRALPPEAKSREVYELCEYLGAKKLAALVQKTL